MGSSFPIICTFADNLQADITADGNGNPKISIAEDGRLFLGKFQKNAEVKITLVNRLKQEVQITDWRSPCPCLEINTFPESILPGQTAAFTVKVLPDGYDGLIVKHMPVTFKYEDSSKVLFLPLALVAGNGPVRTESNPSSNDSIKYVKYEDGTMDDKRYTSAAAWLFAGENCPQCNYLKRNVLPELFDKSSLVIQVNLDEKTGFMLLFALENRLNITNPGKPPVLYWKNKIYYGSETIKDLLVARRAGQ